MSLHVLPADVVQDEKPEVKKESDEAMKVDEQPVGSGSKADDVSSLTQLADAAAGASTSTPKPKRAPEPSSEKLANFTRVTPAQFAYISFAPEGKYQPVRAISSTPQQRATATKKIGKGAAVAGASKYAGGGGILLLVDTKPHEAAEFIDLTPPAPAEPAPGAADAAPAAATSAGSYGGMVDENGPEAEMPPAFEVRD